MRVTGTRLNLSPSSWGGLLDNAVSVAPFVRTVDVLRASFEEHRLRRSATGPPKTLPQERMDEGAHWIDDRPQSAAAPRMRPPLLGVVRTSNPNSIVGTVWNLSIHFS